LDRNPELRGREIHSLNSDVYKSLNNAEIEILYAKAGFIYKNNCLIIKES